MALNFVIWCLIFGFDFARAANHETYVTDFQMTFNKDWLNVTSVYHLDQRQRNIQDLYLQTLQDISNNLIVNVFVEGLGSDQEYHESAFKFKIDFCKMNKIKGSPFLMLVKAAIEKYSRLPPHGCPVKKDVFFIKNFWIDSKKVPPFVVTSKIRFNLEMFHKIGGNSTRLTFMQWYIEQKQKLI